MFDLLSKLAGDRRSIGLSNEDVADVLVSSALCSSIISQLEFLTANSSPAMQSWGRKLLAQLGSKDTTPYAS
jgi:hypothetical protein